VKSPVFEVALKHVTRAEQDAPTTLGFVQVETARMLVAIAVGVRALPTAVHELRVHDVTVSIAKLSPAVRNA
jgi:hypothetical protein